MPAFTQAIEAHQRRITQAILEHALKICSEKNVSGGSMDQSVLQFQSSPPFPVSLIGGLFLDEDGGEDGGGGWGPQGEDLRGGGQPQGRSARHGLPCHWAAQEVETQILSCALLT